MWWKEIRHPGLNTYRYIRGAEFHVVEQKAQAQLLAWEERWQRKVAGEQRQGSKTAKKQLAEERTLRAKGDLTRAENTLLDTLTSPTPANWWDSLRNTASFPTPPPVKPLQQELEPAPYLPGLRYRPQLGFLDYVIPPLKRKKVAAAEARHRKDTEAWLADKTKSERQYAEGLKRYEQATTNWTTARAEYVAAQKRTNAGITERDRQYRNHDPGAVADYCDLVLAAAAYPDSYPREAEIDYVPESRLLVVEYSLPSPEVVPKLKEVRYVLSRDQLNEIHLSDTAARKLYDDLLYKIALRSVYELFRADSADALESIVFNGWVRSIDRASGLETNACILSLQAGKAEFQLINLAQVDPKACFRKLKGVGSASLIELAPIRPILQISREDKRFIAGRAVVASLNEGVNLAAMDWEDFEHLIRELFAKEFSQNGGEVKITQASRDAGVDAVAFDPDPIRGGKIVIQAKRYTNTVGVSAVRDLYGTVMNEGANKGILVTTADYGPDAYGFAKDKPLTLLNGAELLYLLQKHGHRAKIDLKEAKAILAEQERYK